MREDFAELTTILNARKLAKMSNKQIQAMLAKGTVAVAPMLRRLAARALRPENKARILNLSRVNAQDVERLRDEARSIIANAIGKKF